MLLDSSAIKDISCQFEELLKAGNFKEAALLADQVPQVALLILDLPPQDAVSFFESAGRWVTPSALQTLPASRLCHFLNSIDEDGAIKICAMLPADLIVDVLKEMEEDWRNTFLKSVPEEQRVVIERLFNYDEKSVGAIMSVEYLAVRAGSSIAELKKMIKAIPKGKLDHLEPSIFVVKDDNVLVGMITWRSVLLATPDVAVDGIMDSRLRTIRDTDLAMDASRAIKDQNLSTLPVVDVNDHLVGVVDVEKALEISSMDAVRNSFLLGFCVAKDEFVFTRPLGAVPKRLPWMMLNVFLNLGAVALISSYEETIEAIPIIAAFLPMITDMGGNVGIQALSVAVRGIALNEASIGDIIWLMYKECTVGILNGTALGILFGIIAFLLERNPHLGVCAGVALGVNVLMASLFGGIIPFLLKKCALDPAMMSGPLITTVSDCTGVAMYLGLSTAMMSSILADEGLSDDAVELP